MGNLGDMSARLVVQVQTTEATKRVKDFSKAVHASFAEVEASTRTAQASARSFRESWQGTFGAMQQGGMILGGVGAGILMAAKSGVQASIQMEQYAAKLTVALKSTAAAAKMLEWAKRTAAQTPFEMSSVVDATTRLEMYGMSATQWFPLIGDMAGAMGRDVTDAVEAIADAISGGGMERLKEFAVTGPQLRKLGWSGDYSAKGIETLKNALQDLLKDRFAGGMEKLMNTAAGAMSNFMDAVFRLRTAIGDALMPIIKDLTPKIGELIDKVKDFADTTTGQELIKAGAVFGGIAVALAPLLLMLPSILTALANWEAILVSIKALFAAIGAFLTGPIGIALGVILSVGAAIKIWANRLKDVRKEREEQAKIDGIEAAYPTADAVKARIADIERELEARKKLAEEFKKKYRDKYGMEPGTDIPAGDDTFRGQLQRHWEEAKRRIEELEKELEAAERVLKDDFPAAEEEAAKVTQAVTAEMREAWKKAAEERAQQITNAITMQRDYNDLLEETARSLLDDYDAVADAQRGIEEAYKASAEAIASAQDTIREAIENADRVRKDGADAVADAEDKARDAALRATEEQVEAKDRLRRAARDWSYAEQDAIDAVQTARDRANDQVRKAEENLVELQRRRWLKTQPKFVREYYEQLDEQRQIYDARRAVEEAKRVRAVDIADAQEKARRMLESAYERRQRDEDAARKSVESANKAASDAQDALQDAKDQADEANKQAQQRITDAQVALNKTLLEQEERITEAYQQRADAVESLALAVEEANRRMMTSYYQLAYAQQLAGLPVSAAPVPIQGPPVTPVSMGPNGTVQRGGVTVNFNAPIYGEDHLRRLARDEVAGAVKSARYATWGG